MQTGIKHTIKKPEGSYFMTLTIVEWIDLFTRERYSKIIIESLKFCSNNKGLNIFAYVIMSNHVHLIANCESNQNLSDILRDFKKFSSKQIIDSIKSEPESRRDWMLERFSKAANSHTKKHSYKVWQDGNHAIELYSEKFTWTKLQYIHKNPVRAGLVFQPEQWKYSSASNYLELESAFQNVHCLTPPVNNSAGLQILRSRVLAVEDYKSAAGIQK